MTGLGRAADVKGPGRMRNRGKPSAWEADLACAGRGIYGQPMGGFIVERYWPGVTEADVDRAAAALRAAGGADIRYLGSILVPGDEVVLFRFLAVNAQRVAASSEQAALRPSGPGRLPR